MCMIERVIVVKHPGQRNGDHMEVVYLGGIYAAKVDGRWCYIQRTEHLSWVEYLLKNPIKSRDTIRKIEDGINQLREALASQGQAGDTEYDLLTINRDEAEKGD